MNDQIAQLLDKLRLHGMANALPQLLTQVEQHNMAFEDALLELLQTEYQSQHQQCLERRLKRATLPWPWTLDSFPFEQQPGIDATQIHNLAKLNFIERQENIIFIGNPGTGKSGLAMGLLRQAVINGYRGRFFNAQDMLNELYASLADRSTSKLLKSFANYDAIVIDELGYLTLNQEQINIFFKLIDMRYRKHSTIITTNLPLESWYDVFKQKTLVDAMLDRLKHQCILIPINGPSLRTTIIQHKTQPET